jgi:hypothetical protein
MGIFEAKVGREHMSGERDCWCPESMLMTHESAGLAHDSQETGMVVAAKWMSAEGKVMAPATSSGRGYRDEHDTPPVAWK